MCLKDVKPLEDWEVELLDKIDSGEELFESDIEDLVYESTEIHREVLDIGDWHTSICSVVRVGNRLFEICWNRGNTDYQDDTFPFQPEEVEEYKEVMEVTKYRPIKK